MSFKRHLMKMSSGRSSSPLENQNNYCPCKSRYYGLYICPSLFGVLLWVTVQLGKNTVMIVALKHPCLVLVRSSSSDWSGR